MQALTKWGGVDMHHFDIFQPVSAESVGRVTAIGQGVLDTHEVDLRPGLGASQKEGALARAYLDLHRAGIAE